MKFPESPAFGSCHNSTASSVSDDIFFAERMCAKGMCVGEREEKKVSRFSKSRDLPSWFFCESVFRNSCFFLFFDV